MSEPRVSVILSTWNRGRHILPTVHSVLGQEFGDFELLVVGDHCTDDTEAQLGPLLSDRVRWLNLPERGGSQSFPNNAGIAAARGDYIAYIGHDDIWSPDHLQRLVEVLDAPSQPEFGVSGCVFHTPPGTGIYQITGFIEAGAPLRDFCPPSSFMHRKAAVPALGGWRPPAEITSPVDQDLLIRARDAGYSFMPTDRLTVHKFAAGHRYLSYLDHDSSEQAAMLALLAAPGVDARAASWVDLSRARGQFMKMPLMAFAGQAKGNVAAVTAKQKGSRMAPPTPLGAPVTIDQTTEPRGLDWREMVKGQPGWRWSGPNPRPRVLIPYSGPPDALLVADIMHPDPDVLRGIRFVVRGREIVPTVVLRGDSPAGTVARASFTLPLVDQHTVLEIVQPGDHAGNTGDFRGIALGRIWLRPLGA